MDQIDYRPVLDFMVEAGQRLAERAGRIADIGINKTDLTVEDLVIERGFKTLIQGFSGEHVLYAEEEHDLFKVADHVWVIDPISGTKNFIAGQPHYAIVAAHLVKGQANFSAVYDPSTKELFTAQLNQGARCNNLPLVVSTGQSKIILRPSSQWGAPMVITKAQKLLADYEVEQNDYSLALNYCAVAAGRADGILSFTKDSFPEFAGSLIVREAGGRFTNLEGKIVLRPGDRVFIGGNQKTYEPLLSIARQAME
jgi:myo-inositol-1(or 4)-monophosphatase